MLSLRIGLLVGASLLASAPAAQAANSYVIVDSGTVVEGTGGITIMPFRVHIDPASSVALSFDYRTSDGSAIAPYDYYAAEGTLVVPAGETEAQLPVYIVPDAVVEQTESVLLHLSNCVNCTLLQPLVVCSIIDDDARGDPHLSVADVVIKRGLSGSRQMVFDVTLDYIAPVTVSGHVATADVTALAGVDYAANSGDLVFQPGEVSHEFPVTIFGTATPTADKVMLLALSAGTVPATRPAGAGILKYGESPIVALTAPVARQLFTAPASIAMTVVATDPDSAITKVEFYRDGVKIGEDDHAPYAFTWAAAPPGIYQLTAVATTASGIRGSSDSVPVLIVAPGFDRIFESGFE